MATIVFESDKRVREVLTSLLTAAGQKKILATGHPGQFQHWLREEDSNTRLIVMGSHPGEDVQLLLMKMIEGIRGLDGVPLLYLSDAKFPFIRQSERRKSKFSRIDEFLSRPFGLNSLKKAITRAHEARAISRDVIIYFADRPSETLAQVLYEFELQFHWQEVVFVKNVEEFTGKIAQFGWRVGGVFISPTAHSETLAAQLFSMRNTRFGAQTPFVLLSQASEDIVRFRNLCDIFLPTVSDVSSQAESSWLNILQITSGRLRHNWVSREIQNQVRSHIRASEFTSAALLLADGLRMDAYRFELLELAGALEEKKGHMFQATVLYKRSLSINPCSPYSHLRLIDIVKDTEEKKFILKHGAQFCPRHPQVQNQIQLNSNVRSGLKQVELAQ
jgi:hypothetical protein